MLAPLNQKIISKTLSDDKAQTYGRQYERVLRNIVSSELKNVKDDSRGRDVYTTPYE